MQRIEQRVHAGESPGGVGREAAHERRPQPPRERRGIERSGAREHGRPQLVERAPLERARSREGLPERHAERELIRGGRDRAALPLLGRHVRRGPEQRARLRQPAEGQRVARGRGRLRGRAQGADILRGRERIEDRIISGGRREIGVAREAEVGHHDAPAATAQHVVRLEVAVHDPRGMRGREPAPRRHEGLEDLGRGPRRRPQPVGERLTVDELHGHVVAPARGAHLVHHDDVRMGQPRHRARLPQQSLARGITAGIRAQHLHGHPTLEIRVEGEVHHAHRTGA